MEYLFMEYKGFPYELRQTANPTRWEWVAHISATRRVMGFSPSKETAVYAAERAIKRANEHRGVEFRVAPVERGHWKWEFRIGDKIKTGKTETMFREMAVFRVRLLINRELRKQARQDAAG
jgi:hypothetical protein